jgi:hypothetical protein
MTCGHAATGKFCSNCGATLRNSCRSCGSEMSGGVKFCPECGNPTGRVASSASAKPWIVAGGVTVVVALAAVVWTTASRTQVAPPTPTGLNAPATTDITQMSPREQANRLFDRVMSAQERGDQAEVDFFVPMAIQAHALLGGLDNDARYHLGLLQSVGGSHALALLQVDSLALEAPGHLFAAMLRGTVALAQDDTSELRRAYRDFLDNYDREMATAKPEYAEHPSSIGIFLSQAQDNVTR